LDDFLKERKRRVLAENPPNHDRVQETKRLMLVSGAMDPSQRSLAVRRRAKIILRLEGVASGPLAPESIEAVSLRVDCKILGGPHSPRSANITVALARQIAGAGFGYREDSWWRHSGCFRAGKQCFSPAPPTGESAGMGNPAWGSGWEEISSQEPVGERSSVTAGGMTFRLVPVFEGKTCSRGRRACGL